MKEYSINKDEEKRLIKDLEQRHDSEASRIRRYLSMPDLSRTEGSPILELVRRITSIPDFKNFDVIHVPEIMSTKIAFDLFDFPADHPSQDQRYQQTL
jgi:phenylalanyl-tRNA synthetase alpha subunit